ncbi:hypothetical protein ACFE04_014419 [Oxalis oulophora]
MLLQLAFYVPLFIFPLLFFIYIFKKSIHEEIPKTYPFVGTTFAMLRNRANLIKWTSSVLHKCPSSTLDFHAPGLHQVMTANPANVQHILKTRFDIYPKGPAFRNALRDFLGNGIFNADGQTWKYQRQVASHEFNTRSLRKFIETVVDTEVNERLIPLLADAAANKSVLDLQDVLQRFAFDNICKIAFGFDAKYLLPTLPKSDFAESFDYCVMVSAERLRGLFPLIWKVKRFFNVGDERRLRTAAKQVIDFAKCLVREKAAELKDKTSLDSMDLLSRFLTSGHSDEDLVTDIVISFIVAGRDTTSAALTWFFYLLYNHPNVENEILTEIKEKSHLSVYEEAKDMVYTHAALCESMRLYPPVPVDTKEADIDDIWPDGTVVKKGYRAVYNIYAMGRSEKLWGSDWADYKPERWLKKNEDNVEKENGEKKKWNFVARDQYDYPVFQAGPRVCLGKEMAFLQMKRIVGSVLQRFKVVPAFDEGIEPEFVGFLTAKMKNGFPVRIEERAS